MTQRYSIVATNHCGPKAEELVKQIAPGELVVLVREPNNTHDRNAVAVWVRGMKIGYIPRKNNAALAQLIDQTGSLRSFVVGDFVIAQDISQQQRDERILPGVSFSTTAPQKAIEGRFSPSPNSGYPQIEI